jgi:2-polyprenyl-3-methyl-5-hydroxy-6-metoxy-1,4-benzoquinol methylase
MNEDSAKTQIKAKKGEFWSRPGAGETYHQQVSSSAGVVRIKNLVEQAVVVRHAQGRILDAGTGSGRFARALAVLPDNSVVALDVSEEMLAINRQVSEQKGIGNIEYVQGDIEHLTFASNEFDSLVSITVVRHFPQWKAILAEYTRVVKPGGKLVFEMCSGDHIRAANRISARFGQSHGDGGYFNYEAEVGLKDLKAYLQTIGVEVEECLTYDYLNSNCFIKIVTLNRHIYRVVNKGINVFFSVFPIPNVWAFLELKLLRYLPTQCSYNYLIIARKAM